MFKLKIKIKILNGWWENSEKLQGKLLSAAPCRL